MIHCQYKNVLSIETYTIQPPDPSQVTVIRHAIYLYLTLKQNVIYSQ